MKLYEHLYQVGGPSLSHFYDASVYLLEAEDGLYLIDCGTPDGIVQILSNIKGLGFELSDIRAVYGTHGHYAHIGAALLLKKKYGCKLFLHKEDQEQVESGDENRTNSMFQYGRKFPACVVDGLLVDGDLIPFGNNITMEVIHTPGHTPGSVCFSMNMKGYSFLIAGDTIYGGFSKMIGSNEMQWKKSLEKITLRHFDAFTHGHVSASIIGDADNRLKELKEQFGIIYSPWFNAMRDQTIENRNVQGGWKLLC